MLKNTDAVINAVRYAVRIRGSWATFVAENGITFDQIGETAKALASLAYPNDEPVQTETVTVDGKDKKVRTRYGNAVQAAKAGLSYVIDKPDTDTTPDWLALAVQAAKNATAHEITAEDVLTAVKAAIAAQA